MLYQLSVIFIVALILVAIARQAAFAVGLVDKPDARKRHQGHIPLVGGVVIYLTVTLMTCWQPAWLPQSGCYVLCISALALLGVLDDRFDLPVAPRVLVQGGIAFTMMLAAGMQLNSLGRLWGQGELLLGYGALVITPLAVWAAINAWNMVDGIDGQLGALSCITFAALAILFAVGGQATLAQWCLGVIAALAAFLLFNLSVFGSGRKVFMGDAGSMVIGFTVLWLLIAATQGPSAVMRPVTALWLIAIPLMDMVTVMIRRVLRGQSPFVAGRDHLHHILMRRGLSARQALAVSCLLALGLAAAGIVSERLRLAEGPMLLAFLLCFLTYFIVLRESRRVSAFTTRSTIER
ncbi:UDP-N-acetylglucosamine--undecaprenyl-phosphate N-acetylglucosaminephosphotransferase [Affinibrenneria salicis]|uniref:Undecaprenyl-phosphate alpha-N-acetylglucosaminyl 1-phosphate transferase n=1 Tax=Affinibrenneria salicis TaxID=2590031 RepID=A0A5J5FTP4_9GAMM|nr:UDP-N-acetylglucosamine--undecaprenyl-phosphate N-acetylglucosaminephosphotransferase [Affinibrenneria salicis]KAA8996983.1 UDP-N-acetylglucosamine--undecaprenyl-phosphate N-acetylglucosaminephosphotransferase [Affinibrenneria salicis]